LIEWGSAGEDKIFRDYIFSGLEKSGAIHFGHFELLSGQHSAFFLRYSWFGSAPENSRRVGETLAARFALRPRMDIDQVVGPITAGGLLVFELAERLGIAPGFFDVDSRSRPAAVRPRYSINPGQRILIVNDLATTGHGIKRMIDIVNDYDATVVGVALFATRGNRAKSELERISEEYSIPVETIIHLKAESESAEVCTLCNRISRGAPFSAVQSSVLNS
jgi:orotate phosphoribosyltransferase